MRNYDGLTVDIASLASTGCAMSNVRTVAAYEAR